MPPLLLADFAPLSPQAQLALFSVLSIGVALSIISANFRRKPPIDVDLTKLAATMESVSAAVEKLETSLADTAGHKERIATLERECATLRQELDREVTAQRAYTQRTTKELFERIEGVEQSVGRNFQAVERALGRIEGQIAANARVLTAPAG